MDDLLLFVVLVVVAAVGGIGLGMLVAGRLGHRVDPDEPSDEEPRDDPRDDPRD